MRDDDRDVRNGNAVDDLPTASLRITARMAVMRASQAREPSGPGQSDTPKRPTPRPLPDSPYATARVTAVRPRTTSAGARTLITAAQPRVTAGPSSGTSKQRRVTTGPSSDTAKQSRVTAVQPRATAVQPRVTARMPATTDRHSAPVRRVRPEETALVQRVTQVLAIVEPVPERALALPDDPSDQQTDVTILPATQAPPLLLPLIRADRRPRSWYAVAGAWGLAVLLIGALLAAIGPLAGQDIHQAFSPRAVQLASDGTIPHPTGPWDASAGALNYLGVGGGAGPGVNAPGSAGLPVSQASKAKPTSAPVAAPPAAAPSSISPAPVSPWPPSNPYMAVPGHPGYAVTEPSPDNYWWAWGQCTWWAQRMRPDENLTHMGNAMYWASGAAARGYRVGSVAIAGATVVFQPGVQGAGGAGHVAHVVAVYPDGWFLVSEMNFYWNGGGWARVDYRYAHQGSGVSFIY